MSVLVADDSIWIREALEEYPTVISYEYWRLKDMLAQKQPYGANYLIKDLMESVIKFYVLASCSWAEFHHLTDFSNRVLPKITTPNLSLELRISSEVFPLLQRVR